jgi:uncharacterized membrane protein HdeD (DUF308 family)
LKNKHFKKKNFAAISYLVIAGASLYWFVFRADFFSFTVTSLKTFDWWVLLSGVISVYTGIILLFFEQYKKKTIIITMPLYVNIFVGVIVLAISFLESFLFTTPLLICHYSLLKSMEKLVSH